MVKLSVHAALVSLRDRWRRMRRKRSSLAELAACPPGELQRIAQDVGVSVSDLRIIAAAHPGPSELLPLRLELLGLDPGYVRSAQTATYRDLERTCAMCTAWRRCARDLANGDVQAGMDSYCLCSPTIDALAVDRGRPAAGHDVRAMATQETIHVLAHVPPSRAPRRTHARDDDASSTSIPASSRGCGAGMPTPRRAPGCLSCRMSERCLRWLDDPAEAGRAPGVLPQSDAVRGLQTRSRCVLIGGNRAPSSCVPARARHRLGWRVAVVSSTSPGDRLGLTQPLMEQDELFRRLAVALAIGLLIGLERGWQAREEAEGERTAGSEPTP